MQFSPKWAESKPPLYRISLEEFQRSFLVLAIIFVTLIASAAWLSSYLVGMGRLDRNLVLLLLLFVPLVILTKNLNSLCYGRVRDIFTEDSPSRFTSCCWLATFITAVPFLLFLLTTKTKDGRKPPWWFNSTGPINAFVLIFGLLLPFSRLISGFNEKHPAIPQWTKKISRLTFPTGVCVTKLGDELDEFGTIRAQAKKLSRKDTVELYKASLPQDADSIGVILIFAQTVFAYTDGRKPASDTYSDAMLLAQQTTELAESFYRSRMTLSRLGIAALMTPGFAAETVFINLAFNGVELSVSNSLPDLMQTMLGRIEHKFGPGHKEVAKLRERLDRMAAGATTSSTVQK